MICYSKTKKGKLVVVELKLGSIGRQALNQIKKYVHKIRHRERKPTEGIIICKDIMPAFQDLYKKQRDIKVFYYGWKLEIMQ